MYLFQGDRQKQIQARTHTHNQHKENYMHFPALTLNLNNNFQIGEDSFSDDESIIET